MKWRNFYTVFAIMSSFFLSAQQGAFHDYDTTRSEINEERGDIISANMADMMDEAWLEYQRSLKVKDKEIKYIHDEGEVVVFDDSVYQHRLKQLDLISPIEFHWNEPVANSIHYFTRKRRKFTSLCLARSTLYFPLFEEQLKKYNMPVELKYLAMIESGLRPTAKSRAGALGLWQFMYRTGKMYGLDNNSYVDQRRDPYLSTEAACQYLSYLHRLYDDWSMALAAYNAGPGNVNKAIRKAEGRMTYWEIREHLPKETQNYVPSFIAAVYMMEYAKEHNIRPAQITYYEFETDTVCPRKSLLFSVVDSLIDIPVEELLSLNPIFESDYVPVNDDVKYCIRIPVDKIGVFMEMEDSIYALTDSIRNSKYVSQPFVAVEKKDYHFVNSGETLSHIANKYKVTVNEIMAWNNLRSTNIRVGQKLLIRSAGKKSVKKEADSDSQNQQKTEPTPYTGEYTYYVIQKGDNLWDISQKMNVNLNHIESLNPDLNASNLKVGEKIKIPKQ